MRKPVFDVSSEVRHIPACVATINYPLIIDSQKVCQILKVIVVYANFYKKYSLSFNCIYFRFNTIEISLAHPSLLHGVQRRMISVVNFSNLQDYYFCFVVTICDLVHDVETIFHLSYLLTAYGNLF